MDVNESDSKLTPDYVILKRTILGIAAIACGLISVVTASVVVSVRGPLFVIGLILVGALLAASLVAFAKYYQLTFSWQTKSNRPPHKADLRVSTGDIKEMASSIYLQLNETSVVAFHDLIVTPPKMVERITESVETLSRSTLVRSTQTVVFPKLFADSAVVVPVHRQAKDQLGAGMRFYGEDNGRLSSLSQRYTLAYTAAAIRFLAYSIHEDTLDDYMRYLEDEVLSGLAAFPGSDEVRRLKSPSFARQLYALDRRASPRGVFVLFMIESLIAEFLDNRIVCIQIVVPKISKSAPFAHHVRLTSEVRLPPRIRLSHAPDTRASRLRKFVNEARRWAGVRPSLVYFRLSNADRTASYHVQIKGPEGTYLGRQELVNVVSSGPVDEGVGDYAMSPRRGQRHSHLYIHGGERFGETVFLNHFFERMPGSMGGATMSAVAAALLIWLCAIVSLNRHVLTESAPIGGTDLVAVLLAFPVIIALWVGIDRQQSLVGDVMVARVAKFFTVTLCVIAAYCYVLTAPSSEDQSGLWMWIGGLASLNMFCCCASWYLRARVHDHFIRSSEDE